MKSLPSITSEIDEKIIYRVIDKNFSLLAPFFYSFVSNWLIRAYKRYNDIDKFIIVIYLIHQNLVFYRKNGLIIDYESFYRDRTLEINKINISDISKDRRIPKESVRRKMRDIEKNGAIKKMGKKIFKERSTLHKAKATDTVIEWRT